MEYKSSITKHYSNGEVTIVWKPSLCTHVAICFTELPEVFDLNERPWINPYGAPTEKIINQVSRCPSGALTFFYNNQNTINMENENKEKQTRIEIAPNGPYVVKGKCILVDKAGLESETEEVFALCRCGKSKNKPFCDGLHLANPFE